MQFIFGKGGDRFVWNIPEVAVCQEFEIEIRDGLGIKIIVVAIIGLRLKQ